MVRLDPESSAMDFGTVVRDARTQAHRASRTTVTVSHRFRIIAGSARDLAFLLLCAAPTALRAQQWIGGATLPLVREASANRTAQATDTTLASWHATATGLIRLGPIADPGNVTSLIPTKADELTV